MTDAPTPPAGPPPVNDTQAASEVMDGWFRSRLGGVVVPLVAAFLAFVVGGDRHPRRRPQPARGLPGDLRRNRAEPGVLLRRRVGHRLEEPPADAHRLHAARLHRHRGRLRVPLRHVQHRRPGPVPRRLLRLDLRRDAPRRPARRAAHRALHRRRDRHRNGLGRHRRAAEGERRRPRGDHDDHAQLDRDLRRPVALRAGRADPGRRAVAAQVGRAPRGRQAPDVRNRAPAGPRRRLHRDRRARRLHAAPEPDDARVRGARGRASTPRRRATAASPWAATTSWRSRSPADSRASAARSTTSAGSSRSRRTTSR